MNVDELLGREIDMRCAEPEHVFGREGFGTIGGDWFIGALRPSRVRRPRPS